MERELVGVVGAGVIGCGVAQCLAEAGYETVLLDVSAEKLEQAHKSIRQGLRMRVMKGAKLDVAACLARLQATTEYAALKQRTFVVENATEDLELKLGIYAQLEAVCPPEAIFAANTSTIPVSRLAEATGRAPQVIGIHFMNPVPLKPAVEVIRSAQTSESTLQRTRALLQTIHKEWIDVSDSPGFVSNRVLMLTINEAVQLLGEGVSSVEGVDKVFRSCFGHPMGPLETADLIGLDTIVRSLESLQSLMQSDKYRPARLLLEAVAAGNLGRKTGQGFYTYSA